MNGFPRLLTLGIVLVTLGCGKVGDPLPPFVRMPEAALDFGVEQRAYELHFVWTNPVRNVDESASTDVVRILLSDGEAVVARIPRTSSTGPQTHIMPARDLVGSSMEFAVRFETSDAKVSAPSNVVGITVVEVPGPAVNLGAVLDQGRISLAWLPPTDLDTPVDAYRVYRSGQSVTDKPIVSTALDDTRFEVGASYEYTVVSLRRTSSGWVEGIAAEPLELTALDRTPPAPPRGSSLTPAGDGVFVTWDTSPETDVVRYRIFRRESPAGEFRALESEPRTTTAFFDPEFLPGYHYAVSAIDEAGNESLRSEVVP